MLQQLVSAVTAIFFWMGFCGAAFAQTPCEREAANEQAPTRSLAEIVKSSGITPRNDPPPPDDELDAESE